MIRNALLRDADGIVFDLDGTLVDSAPDLHAISAEILHNLGLIPYSLAEIRGFIGHGIDHLVTQCLDGRNFTDAPHERQQVLERFLRKYRLRPAVHAELYPGVIDFLYTLKAAGKLIGICTNKHHDIAEAVVHELGLDAFTVSLVGGGRTDAKKPDPAPLLLCLSEMGVPTRSAVYIGDSETDEATALATGIPFVLFEGGYRKRAVEDFKAVLRFDDYSTLVETPESEALL